MGFLAGLPGCQSLLLVGVLWKKEQAKQTQASSFLHHALLLGLCRMVVYGDAFQTQCSRRCNTGHQQTAGVQPPPPTAVILLTQLSMWLAPPLPFHFNSLGNHYPHAPPKRRLEGGNPGQGFRQTLIFCDCRSTDLKSRNKRHARHFLLWANHSHRQV